MPRTNMRKKNSVHQKSFLKALANYSAIGGAMIGGMTQAQATIQYATLSGTPVSSTLGNNATVAIGVPTGTLVLSHFFSSLLSAVIGGGVKVIKSGAHVQPFSANVTVSAGGAWNSDPNVQMGYNNSGPWQGTTGKFIAFQFNNGGIKYGWIRVDVAATTASFTPIDWAYEDDGSTIRTGQQVALPVALLSFDAQSFAESISLVWTTAQEENLDRFALERAKEGESFYEIASLPGKGNSNGPRQYAVRDEEIAKNVRYYYRLKSIDLDGSYTYSQVVEASIMELGFVLNGPYPNPVTGGSFTIDINATEGEVVHIQLFSPTGQLAHEQRRDLSSGGNSIRFSLPELSTGIYFLKVQGRYYSQYKQIIVQ